MFILRTIVLLVIFLSNSYVEASRSFVIDTDVGADDVLAIFYLLKQKDIDIKAISIVGTGESHCAFGLRNINGLLALRHKTDIPVACGRSSPLAGQHHFPNWLRHQVDDLGTVAHMLPKVTVKSSQSAIQLLEDTLMKAKEPIEILAIGPLTNLADLLIKTPLITNKIKRIYIMGGAINAPGNIPALEPNTKNTTAEWNIFIDPTAADKVFRSNVPITLISLDVINQVPISKEFYYHLQKNKNSLANPFIYELFHHNEAEILANKWYFWDVISAVIANDHSIVETKNQKISIALSPEEKIGTTKIDEKGSSINLCVAVNKAQLERILKEVFS